MLSLAQQARRRPEPRRPAARRRRASPSTTVVPRPARHALPAALRALHRRSTATARTASSSWPPSSSPRRAAAERPDDLRALDAAREADPDWFLANRMLGGVCYVDRYAGDLAGRARAHPLLPRARAHLPAPDAAVPGAGGQLRRRLRGVQLPRGEPGARRRWTTCGRSPPTCGAAGISLVVDFIFNHTCDEHEWAQRRAGRRPGVRGLLPDLPRPHDARRLRADDARDLPRRPPRLVRAAAGRPLDLVDLPPLPVGPELREPRRVHARWRGRCSSSRTSASRCCGWTRSRSSGSELGTACENLPAGAPAAAGVQRGLPHRRARRCCSSPRRSCTPTRSSSTSRRRSASSPTTRCRWR